MFMYWRFLGMVVVGISLLFGGCGRDNSLPPQLVSVSSTATSTATPDTEHSDSSTLSSAADIVSTFMTALLQGESQTIRALLTPLARQKGEEMGIPFAPKTTHAASFTVDQTIPQGKNCTYVHTTLTDLNEKGEKESAEIIWIVAQNNDGWRIAGAAVALFDGQEKTLLNFEDPEAAQNAISAAENQFVTQNTANNQ
ncbi:MAG: hypothetical protein LBF88_13375 [Planctomycetaceae bacterium]|jgi:hypothetical protein|nr:hypothetical protein [Planctomycetaceae bacterium]